MMRSSVDPGHLARGRVLFDLRRYREAAREFHLAAAADPADPAPAALLGLALLAQDRVGDAQDAAREAIRRDPDHPGGYYVLGRVLFCLNRFGEAASVTAVARRLNPMSSAVHAQIAEIAEAEKDWPAVLDAARRGLAADPFDAECHRLRASALVRQGRAAEAIDELRRALAHRPEQAALHERLGFALLHAGQPGDALPHLREALRLDPNSDTARAGAAEALKARNPAYARIMRAFLWVARRRLAHPALLLMIGTLWFFGMTFLGTLWEPALFIMLGGFATGTAVVVTHGLSVSLFDMAMLFNRDGRWMLSRHQKEAACAVLGCLAAATVGVAAALTMTGLFWFFALPTGTVVAWLIGTILRSPPGPGRKVGTQRVLPFVAAGEIGLLVAIFAELFALGETVLVAGLLACSVGFVGAGVFGFLWLIVRDEPFGPVPGLPI